MEKPKVLKGSGSWDGVLSDGEVENVEGIR